MAEPDLAAALQALLNGHDALRLQLARRGDGDWNLKIPPPGTVSASDCMRHVDLTGLDEPHRQERMQAEFLNAEGRLNPQAGCVLQAVWFTWTVRVACCS